MKLKAYLLAAGGYHSLWGILLDKQRLCCLLKAIIFSLGGQEGKIKADLVAAGVMVVPMTLAFCLHGRGFFRVEQHVTWRREGLRFQSGGQVTPHP